ncbi:unnamed protein product [Amoebophrya sp. A25]|nr:unnamed protein product [Amoebophrya sp. A25]|eukprot:GSA25T00004687001.1
MSMSSTTLSCSRHVQRVWASRSTFALGWSPSCSSCLHSAKHATGPIMPMSPNDAKMSSRSFCSRRSTTDETQEDGSMTAKITADLLLSRRPPACCSSTPRSRSCSTVISPVYPFSSQEVACRGSTTTTSPGALFHPSKPLLGPKKKGGKDAGGKEEKKPIAPGAGDVFNIFANVPDVQLKDDACYPDWLWTLNEPGPTYGELSLMFIYGHKIEDANLYLYRRFLRMHRKLCIKVNNLRLKKSKRRIQVQVD